MLRKNLPVLLAFLKKSKLSVFLFFLMMFLAQLSLTYCLGNYNYISRYEDSFKAIPGRKLQQMSISGIGKIRKFSRVRKTAIT